MRWRLKEIEDELAKKIKINIMYIKSQKAIEPKREREGGNGETYPLSRFFLWLFFTIVEVNNER